MASPTGENEQGLRKIIDLTRMISIIILLLHFYFTCYATFKEWNLTSTISDRILNNIAHTGLFTTFHTSKLIALAFLTISLIGVRGRKTGALNYRLAFTHIGIGLLIYLASAYVFSLSVPYSTIAITYIVVTTVGFLLYITGAGLLTRIIKFKLNNDIFNKENETFPQEERFIKNNYSINLPARYKLKGKVRKSWINIINPFRGLLVMGSPGSGKSYFVIQHIIKQHIEKGFSMFVYDFKYDDLTKIAYNHYLKHKKSYPVTPKFHIINFDDISRSNRCNPLDPSSLFDLSDVAESARTIMLGLNRDWIKKQGDFFVESSINFVTAIIEFLRLYEKGKYCTLPHVIELIQVPYDKLFSVLRTQPQIDVLVNPFISAYLHNAMEQLEGQIASAKISLARLSSPHLYYTLSGNDFTLDINNSTDPKIVCMGNNPQKTQVYGAVISLYIAALTRLINKKGHFKSSLVFDEFATIYFNGIDSLIATARSNKVATTIAVQDASQLIFHYGKEQAEVIMNITGNVISGQVTGATAKTLSDRVGKTMQDRESFSTNSSDTSVSQSKQLEMAIPVSTIASLSSGEFVGMVTDDPDEKIELKAFYCEIVNDHKELQKEAAVYKNLEIVSNVEQRQIVENYLAIKKDVAAIVENELERMLNTPGLEALMVKK
ncbi:conjugal transfer protein MobC [Segetibacter koreensis]|uniref:conjugal transfer protein MobC n=1 Tax=Segetibacter koreensis TaxID=398037 RepID=UPI0003762764|nr:conjugal transfer protein MobC [Segetibacter koreensis]